MPTTLPSPPGPFTRFPWIAMMALFTLCVVPVIALFSIGAVLDRDCVTVSRSEGDAGPSMVWRIEGQRCGNGPLVTNVLIAPRGKTLALAASSTGTPRPIGVRRADDGTTIVLLEAQAGSSHPAVLLPLKASGRPARPLVLANGEVKR